MRLPQLAIHIGARTILPPCYLQLLLFSWIALVPPRVLLAATTPLDAWEIPTTISLPEYDVVDWNSFPDGYRALNSRVLMFPVGQGDALLKIGTEHQLFIDDYLVAERHGLTRQFHRAQKHTANPLVEADRPWEKPLGIGGLANVLLDEPTGKLRMWYYLLRPPEPIAYRGNYFIYPLCYAESENGIDWTKPDMGWWLTDEHPGNNVIFWNNPLGMFVDPWEKDLTKKFKSYNREKPLQNESFIEGLYLFSSPDGISWKQESTVCIILGGYEGDYQDYHAPFGQRGPQPAGTRYNLPLPGLANATPRVDRILKKYVADAKISKLAGKRAVGMLESDDLIHWSPPRVTMFPDQLDDNDEQHYYNYTFCYESMWLGLIRVMRTQPTGWKQTHIELAASRDGRTWNYAANREQFIPLGDQDSWDADYTQPIGEPVLVGNELWFYYMGSRYYQRNGNQLWPTGNGYLRSIGVAKLRQDGFVSLNAKHQPGTLLTRPMTYRGGKLYVNADVGEAGHIKVSVRDLKNKPLPHYTLAKCQGVTTDTVAGRIQWQDNPQLPDDTAVPEQHIRLLFEVKNARLYSFWIH